MNKVYFFSTCLGGAVYSDTCINAINLLRREGVEVIFKKDQTCCGQPAYNSGYFNEAKKIAQFNMNLFKGEYPIIIPSGSCAGVMRVDYMNLFKDTSQEEDAKNFCARHQKIVFHLK